MLIFHDLFSAGFVQKIFRKCEFRFLKACNINFIKISSLTYVQAQSNQPLAIFLTGRQLAIFPRLEFTRGRFIDNFEFENFSNANWVAFIFEFSERIIGERGAIGIAQVATAVATVAVGATVVFTAPCHPIALFQTVDRANLKLKF